ncbi:hypothetical protein H6761_04065 [Candidatus Nomurabacteria bacterium]|nr:hypothetical protein [Candidatus Nomurabacteria bacterium]
MIFYHENKNKLFSLVALTLLASGFIFWQWLKFLPNLKIPAVEENEVVLELGDKAGNLLANAKNSIDQGLVELKNLPSEIEKEKNQEELLKVTRQYLDSQNQQ